MILARPRVEEVVHINSGQGFKREPFSPEDFANFVALKQKNVLTEEDINTAISRGYIQHSQYQKALSPPSSPFSLSMLESDRFAQLPVSDFRALRRLAIGALALRTIRESLLIERGLTWGEHQKFTQALKKGDEISAVLKLAAKHRLDMTFKTYEDIENSEQVREIREQQPERRNEIVPASRIPNKIPYFEKETPEDFLEAGYSRRRKTDMSVVKPHHQLYLTPRLESFIMRSWKWPSFGNNSDNLNPGNLEGPRVVENLQPYYSSNTQYIIDLLKSPFRLSLTLTNVTLALSTLLIVSTFASPTSSISNSSKAPTADPLSLSSSFSDAAGNAGFTPAAHLIASGSAPSIGPEATSVSHGTLIASLNAVFTPATLPKNQNIVPNIHIAGASGMPAIGAPNIQDKGLTIHNASADIQLAALSHVQSPIQDTNGSEPSIKTPDLEDLTFNNALGATNIIDIPRDSEAPNTLNVASLSMTADTSALIATAIAFDTSTSTPAAVPETHNLKALSLQTLTQPMPVKNAHNVVELSVVRDTPRVAAEPAVINHNNTIATKEAALTALLPPVKPVKKVVDHHTELSNPPLPPKKKIIQRIDPSSPINTSCTLTAPDTHKLEFESAMIAGKKHEGTIDPGFSLLLDTCNGVEYNLVDMPTPEAA